MRHSNVITKEIQHLKSGSPPNGHYAERGFLHSGAHLWQVHICKLPQSNEVALALPAAHIQQRSCKGRVRQVLPALTAVPSIAPIQAIQRSRNLHRTQIVTRVSHRAQW